MTFKISELLTLERNRQENTLMMIPSENYTYPEVLEALGSSLVHKYAEGYPGKRYYQGNEFVDEIERICIENTYKAFKLDPNLYGVNVQALSGSIANLSVYNALLAPGDRILSMHLSDGGHLSHGWHTEVKKISFVSKVWEVDFYHVEPETEQFNYDKILAKAKEFLPKLIISGGTAYPREIDHAKMGAIAKEVGAYYLADIAHEAGLVAGGANSSPFAFADVVTMTTQKTLRGPRGAIIVSKKQHSSLIDASVFPGLQGGPHMHTIAGIAVALEKASLPEFTSHTKQVVANAKVLAEELEKLGFRVITGGTDKHLVLLDLRPKNVSGWHLAWALEIAGIIANRNSIPGDTASPFFPSGLRLGTPALTVRGMKEEEMITIAQMIGKVASNIGPRRISDDLETRKAELESYLTEIRSDAILLGIAEEVRALCTKFPTPFK